MRHRPELDGVRGIAILGVLAYHAGEQFGDLLPGGNLGVVVFYVLSGYLISGLLLSEGARTGRIGLRSFYVRRACRLLPALALGLLAIAVARLVAGDAPADVAVGTFGTLLFGANVGQVLAPAVFAYYTFAWSLSTEEQFYALWPGLLTRLPRRTLVVTAVTVIVGTEAVRALMLVAGQRQAAVFAPWCRFDALAIGCLAALLADRIPADLLRRLAPPALAVVALMYGVGGLEHDWTLLVGVPLISAATAVLILAVDGDVTAWLSGRVLGWFGRRSYGIYIWHAAVAMVWVALGGPGVLDHSPWVAVWIGGSLVVSEVSWRLVERPCIAWSRRLSELRQPEGARGGVERLRRPAGLVQPAGHVVAGG